MEKEVTILKTQAKKKKIIKTFFPLILILFILIGIVFMRSKKTSVTIISHRGASGEEIEHSFEAYDLAIAYGSEYIEQDIVMSKDGTLYVSHDVNARRLTGVDKNYIDMNDKEIAKLKIDNEENIHRLEDVFKKYGTSTNYVIETKQRNQVNELVRLVRKYNLEEKVIFQSFDLFDLKEIYKELNQGTYMFLIDNKKDNRYKEALSINYIDIICLNKNNDFDNETVAEVHNYNKKIFFFTIDSLADMKQAKELEVDGIFTNYTAKGLYVFKQPFKVKLT